MSSISSIFSTNEQSSSLSAPINNNINLGSVHGDSSQLVSSEGYYKLPNEKGKQLVFVINDKVSGSNYHELSYNKIQNVNFDGTFTNNHRNVFWIWMESYSDWNQEKLNLKLELAQNLNLPDNTKLELSLGSWSKFPGKSGSDFGSSRDDSSGAMGDIENVKGYGTFKKSSELSLYSTTIKDVNNTILDSENKWESVEKATLKADTINFTEDNLYMSKQYNKSLDDNASVTLTIPGGPPFFIAQSYSLTKSQWFQNLNTDVSSLPNDGDVRTKTFNVVQVKLVHEDTSMDISGFADSNGFTNNGDFNDDIVNLTGYNNTMDNDLNNEKYWVGLYKSNDNHKGNKDSNGNFVHAIVWDYVNLVTNTLSANIGIGSGKNNINDGSRTDVTSILPDGNYKLYLFKNIENTKEPSYNVIDEFDFTISGSSTVSPTQSPTESPTQSPTGSPTQSPTESPTQSPTPSPTFDSKYTIITLFEDNNIPDIVNQNAINLGIVDNPKPSLLNNSQKVYQYEKSSDIWSFIGLKVDINNLQMNTLGKLLLKTYCARSGVTIRVELRTEWDYTKPRVFVDIVNTKVNEWELLEFDFENSSVLVETTHLRHKFTHILILWDAGNQSTPGEKFYFDDILLEGPVSTSSPTKSPTQSPTESPTQSPTKSPTESPTQSPTKSPTESPTQSPTQSPTEAPTKSPTKSPTESPTKSPTESPTVLVTPSPTKRITQSPTVQPIISQPVNDIVMDNNPDILNNIVVTGDRTSGTLTLISNTNNNVKLTNDGIDALLDDSTGFNKVEINVSDNKGILLSNKSSEEITDRLILENPKEISKPSYNTLTGQLISKGESTWEYVSEDLDTSNANEVISNDDVIVVLKPYKDSNLKIVINNNILGYYNTNNNMFTISPNVNFKSGSKLYNGNEQISIISNKQTFEYAYTSGVSYKGIISFEVGSLIIKLRKYKTPIIAVNLVMENAFDSFLKNEKDLMIKLLKLNNYSYSKDNGKMYKTILYRLTRWVKNSFTNHKANILIADKNGKVVLDTSFDNKTNTLQNALQGKIHLLNLSSLPIFNNLISSNSLLEVVKGNSVVYGSKIGFGTNNTYFNGIVLLTLK